MSECNAEKMATKTDVEEDATHKKSLAMQEESMGPLREDLAEWIAKTLGKLYKDQYDLRLSKTRMTKIKQFKCLKVLSLLTSSVCKTACNATA